VQVHCLQVGLGTPCDGRSKPVNKKRAVAQCFIGDKDIAAEMIRLKQACDWPFYSGGARSRRPPDAPITKAWGRALSVTRGR
jgi:endonuclease YncB( thermonuclease family)